MFENFTYFNWLVVASAFRGFLSTLLAWLINSGYRIRTENRDRRVILDGILISLVMAFVGGGLTWDFSFFENNALEDESISSNF